jgi:hypothetical protein
LSSTIFTKKLIDLVLERSGAKEIPGRILIFSCFSRFLTVTHVNIVIGVGGDS